MNKEVGGANGTKVTGVNEVRDEDKDTDRG